jgi:heptaprenyl diphosphate synthase
VARPIDSYLVSIDGKTASLYSTAARIGALVAGHDRATVELLTEFGTAYGMVFQIVDDVLDIIATDDELGKPAGHDMEEGVYTLPVLHTLAAGGAAASELNGILGRPLEHAEREKVLDIVRSNGGVVSAINRARDFVSVAESVCDRLPRGGATEAMRASTAQLLATVER